MSEAYRSLFNNLDQLIGDLGQLPPIRQPEVGAEGHDPGDFVRVLIEQGQISELRIVPGAVKRGNVELAELIAAAVNDGLANYAAAMTAALAEQNPQLAGLQNQFAAINDRALGGLDAVLADSVAVTERISRIGLSLGQASDDPHGGNGADRG